MSKERIEAPGTGTEDDRQPREGAESDRETSDQSSPWSQLARVAARLHSAGVSRGERSELRRMRGDDIPPEIYWRLTADLTWPHRGGGRAFDDFWIAVLPLMARTPHEARARPGRVLAKAGAKPARIERWLRRERGTAWTEAGRLLSITKGAALDWARFGFLLYSWDDPKVKRDFARDYFRAERGRAADTDQEGDS